MGGVKNLEQKEVSHQGQTACFALWFKSECSNHFVEQLIDEALGHRFYPEPEWKKFGVSPPENFPLIGSWRNSKGTIFSFLLECKTRKDQGYSRHVFLYTIGNEDEITKIEKKYLL